MAAPEPIPYYPPEPPLDPYPRSSDELLAAAAILAQPDEEISEELRAQACEKIWGAVTRWLKIFADARRWYYCEHSMARHLVMRIDDALGVDPPALVAGFAVAELLYCDGFYEDLMDLDEIRFRMPIIQALCTMLDDAHRSLPLDLAPPDNSRYRSAARRCAERRARRAAASAD